MAHFVKKTKAILDVPFFFFKYGRLFSSLSNLTHTPKPDS